MSKYNQNYYSDDEDNQNYRFKEENKKKNRCDEEDKKKYRYFSNFYTITHLILSFFALYLSWKCNNNNFDPLSFIAALCCPIIYIIWVLAVNGGCGIFDDKPLNNNINSSISPISPFSPFRSIKK